MPEHCDENDIASGIATSGCVNEVCVNAICLVCSVVFVKKRTTQKLCSNRCRMQALSTTWKARTINCKSCGRSCRLWRFVGILQKNRGS
jgi:hypothetical protein